MLTSGDILLVSDALRAVKVVSRSALGEDVWRLIATHYDDQTGRVGISREAMAGMLDRSSDDVSRALSVLVTIGALSRVRSKGRAPKGGVAVDYYVEEKKIRNGEIMGKGSAPPKPRSASQLEHVWGRAGNAPPALPKDESIFPEWLPMTAAARRLEFELLKRRGAGPHIGPKEKESGDGI